MRCSCDLGRFHDPATRFTDACLSLLSVSHRSHNKPSFLHLPITRTLGPSPIHGTFDRPSEDEAKTQGVIEVDISQSEQEVTKAAAQKIQEVVGLRILANDHVYEA